MGPPLAGSLRLGEAAGPGWGARERKRKQERPKLPPRGLPPLGPEQEGGVPWVVGGQDGTRILGRRA